MPESIVSLGFEVPGKQVTTIALDSHSSLLDWDIILMIPQHRHFMDRFDGNYQGSPSLADEHSFQFKEAVTHWQREVDSAVAAGKCVLVLLPELERLYVGTGKVEYTGTGRNRQGTRIVSATNNYAMLPIDVAPTNSNGTLMAVDPKATFFSEYWDSVGADSEYRVSIENAKLTPLVRTKSGNRVVGAYARNQQGSGVMVLLPYIDFDSPALTTTKDGKVFWNKKALELGKRFVGSVVKLSSSIREQTEATPPPMWVSGKEFELETEKSLRQDLLLAESEMHQLTDKLASIRSLLDQETSLKDLLYEKGKPLERAIIKALRILGFDANPYRESDSEFDVVFQAKEGRLIAEAEGKDGRAINVDKLRQLEMNINEDYAREEVESMAKGVLIGNAHRLAGPGGRPSFFTEKCIVGAKRSSTALLRSVDLYFAAREIKESRDELKAASFRQAIIDSVGIVNLSIETRNQGIEEDKEGT
jgi:hypothetical protein